MNNDRKNRPSSSDFEVTPVRKTTTQREYIVEEVSPRTNRASQRSEALKNARINNGIPAFEVSQVREQRQQKSSESSLHQPSVRTRQTEISPRTQRTQTHTRSCCKQRQGAFRRIYSADRQYSLH